MKKAIIFSLWASSFLLAGCSEFLEDCIFWPAKPRIKTGNLAAGTIGEVYFQKITGDVKNDPNDWEYGYYFEINGRIPEGLHVDGYSNHLILEGKPLEAGDFRIEVSMTIIPPYEYVEDEYDSDRICFGNDTIEKSYVLTIWE